MQRSPTYSMAQSPLFLPILCVISSPKSCVLSSFVFFLPLPPCAAF